jgi:methyl-accepting chemotaxis protein
MNKRKKTLIEPRLQLKTAGLFLQMAALAALTQSLVLGWVLHDLADELPRDGAALQTMIKPALASSFLITVALLTPILLAIGVRASFRVLGPLHRMRVHLRALARGEATEPCAIRASDELQDFCQLLNEATAPLLAHAPDELPREHSAALETPAALPSRSAQEAATGKR